MIAGLWYLAWHATVLAIGWMIASANRGEEGVWVGAAIAILGGPAFTQLAKLARRLSTERYCVRVELHEFRFAWIWTTIWFGGSLIAGWAVADQLFFTYNVESSILAMGVAGMVVGGRFGRMAGRHHAFLRVDVAAGVVEYAGGGQPIAVPLAELAPFEVETYRKPYRTSRHNPAWYRLRTPSLPNVVLADSVYPGGVQRLRAMLQTELDRLRDLAAVRRVLAETPTEGATYRAGPALADAVRAVVDDPRPALRALRRDPDDEIRKRAHALSGS